LNPSEAVVPLLYVNYIEGKFCFILRDKNPTTLVQAKYNSAKIEENIIYSNIDPFHYPRAKAEEKTKISSNSAWDPINRIAHKLY